MNTKGQILAEIQRLQMKRQSVGEIEAARITQQIKELLNLLAALESLKKGENDDS